jgi:hypothetical protein
MPNGILKQHYINDDPNNMRLLESELLGLMGTKKEEA